jgi:DNA-binding LacI/PurR family transcriptional regulator
MITTLQNLSIPFVVADAHSEHDSLYTVNVDYRLAAYTAVKYLIDQGHRRIGFVGNMQLPAFYSQVFSGYQKALREANLSLNLAWCFEKICNRETTERYIAGLLSGQELPTAIFCMEDILAIELIRYLQKNKVSVPDDISVIAIDDIILANEIYPGLTTVAIDKDQLGSSTIDILMKLISEQPTGSVSMTATDIAVRESVKSLIV